MKRLTQFYIEKFLISVSLKMLQNYSVHDFVHSEKKILFLSSSPQIKTFLIRAKKFFRHFL
jgi:hypothetical protein